MKVRPGTAVLALAAAVASAPFLAGYLLPQRGVLLVGLASFAGYSPYGLAVVAVVALTLRHWHAAGAMAVVLAAQAAVLGPAYVGADAGAGPRLVVMSTNVLFGQAELPAVVRIVRELRVDLLAVQELTPAAVIGLRAAGLEAVLPYAVLQPAPSALGAGLWSRSPAREVPAWPSTFRGAAAEVDVGGSTALVRVLHPPPPAGSQVAIWQADYERFVALAAQEETTTPALLVGDFNASVHHRNLRRLMGDRWRDAGEVAGAGLVRTWGSGVGRLAFLDPDHVLVDRGMSVARFDVVEVPGSDHRAVITTVVLPTRP